VSKELKRFMADEIRAELESSSNMLVVRLLQLDAVKNSELRTSLRGHGARLRVIHNRATRHALDDARKPVGDLFKGQTALALADDPEAAIPVAKTLVEAARKNKKGFEIRGGFVDGEILDKAGVEMLAQCPDKHTLRGMLAGTIIGPARAIAVSLQAVGGGLARCIQARVDESAEES